MKLFVTLCYLTILLAASTARLEGKPEHGIEEFTAEEQASSLVEKNFVEDRDLEEMEEVDEEEASPLEEKDAVQDRDLEDMEDFDL